MVAAGYKCLRKGRFLVQTPQAKASLHGRRGKAVSGNLMSEWGDSTAMVADISKVVGPD